MSGEKKTPLPVADVKARLASLAGWEISADGAWLVRRFAFKNFKQAIAFVNQAGEIAEAQKHHPDIKLGWGYAELQVQSHDAGGITERDFALVEAVQGITV